MYSPTRDKDRRNYFQLAKSKKALEQRRKRSGHAIGFSFLCAELQIAIFKWISIETIASLIQSGHAGARDVFGVRERTIFLGMIKERYPWADSLFASLDTVLRWLIEEREGRDNRNMTDKYEKLGR